MRYQMIVESEALEGQDATLAAWFDQRHIPDLLRISAFKSAQRFRVEGKDGAPLKHVIIYEIESDDLPSVFAEVARRRAAGDLPMGEAQKRATLRSMVCEPASEKFIAN